MVAILNQLARQAIIPLDGNFIVIWHVLYSYLLTRLELLNLFSYTFGLSVVLVNKLGSIFVSLLVASLGVVKLYEFFPIHAVFLLKVSACIYSLPCAGPLLLLPLLWRFLFSVKERQGLGGFVSHFCIHILLQMCLKLRLVFGKCFVLYC